MRLQNPETRCPIVIEKRETGPLALELIPSIGTLLELVCYLKFILILNSFYYYNVKLVCVLFKPNPLLADSGQQRNPGVRRQQVLDL